MKKKSKKKIKPLNFKAVLKKAKQIEVNRKVEETKYHVRRLYELLFENR